MPRHLDFRYSLSSDGLPIRPLSYGRHTPVSDPTDLQTNVIIGAPCPVVIIQPISVTTPLRTGSTHWAHGCENLLNNNSKVFLAPNAPPMPVAPGYDVVAMVNNIGILGVAAGDRVFVADALSLADPVSARFPPVPGGRVGHAKQVPAQWELARYAAPSPGDPAGVRAARRALSCGSLHLLQEATDAPMTPSRFLRNLLVAPRLTRLRVPSDPFQAERVLCPQLPPTTPAPSTAASSSPVLHNRETARR